MSHKDSRGVPYPRQLRVLGGADGELNGGGVLRPTLSSENLNSGLGNRQPSKAKSKIETRVSDHVPPSKRARLEREPGELVSSSDFESDDMSLCLSSSDSDDIEIISQDFDMEEEIRNLKLKNLPQPVPIVAKCCYSDTQIVAIKDCDREPPQAPEELPSNTQAKENIAPTETVITDDKAHTSSEPDGSQTTNFCTQCGTDFNDEEFKDHMIIVHLFPGNLKGPCSCPVCKELFTNKSALHRHFKTKHFISNKNPFEVNIDGADIIEDKSPPPLEVDSDENPEEEHSSSANGVQAESLQTLKEENSDASKSKSTLARESKDLPVTNLPDKAQTSPKEDEVSKVSATRSSPYASLPPIVLPPMPVQQMPSQTPPLTTVLPVSKCSTSPPNKKLENAIRDPRIARRNALTLPSGKILPIKEKNGPLLSQLPDSMIIPIKQPPIMRTARQRMEDKWREPEIIRQQGEEIERLKALLKGKDEKLGHLLREKDRTIEKREKKLKIAKANLAEKSKELEELEKKLKSAEMMKKDLDQCKKELESALQREAEHIGAQSQLLESIEIRGSLEAKCISQEKQIEEDRQRYSSNVVKMSEEITLKSTAIRELEEKTRSLNEQIKEFRSSANEVSRLSAKLLSVSGQLKNYEESEKALRKELEEKNGIVLDLRAELSDSRLESQFLENEMKTLKTQFEEKEKEWRKYSRDLKSQVLELLSHHNEKDETIDTLKRQLTSTPDQKTLTETNSHYKSLVSCMEKKIAAMGKKILKLRKE